MAVDRVSPESSLLGLDMNTHKTIDLVVPKRLPWFSGLAGLQLDIRDKKMSF
jgi:hypothetical protein